MFEQSQIQEFKEVHLHKVKHLHIIQHYKQVLHQSFIKVIIIIHISSKLSITRDLEDRTLTLLSDREIFKISQRDSQSYRRGSAIFHYANFFAFNEKKKSNEACK